MAEGGLAVRLRLFSETDLWAPVAVEDLPRELVAAVAEANWSEAKSHLTDVMSGLRTDGVYGRALLQLVRELPIGIDSVFDRYRAAVAIDYGDWDVLRRCMEASPVESRELDLFQRTLLRSINDFTGRPSNSPADNPFVAYEFQLTGRWDWYKRWARRLPAFDASSRLARPDVPAGRHFRNRMVHHSVLAASGEAQAGSLETAAALAGESMNMGDEGEPLRDIASDLASLTLTAMGEDPPATLRIVERTPSPRGMSPLGTFEWLMHVMPFLHLMHDGTFEAATRLLARVSGRLGSPRAQLIASTWSAAAELMIDGSPKRHTELPGVIASSRYAVHGLRVLPTLLNAITTRKHADFEDAERLARRAGNVWVQVAAMTWLCSVDPSPAAARRLLRLVDVSGWRRPVLVPPAVLGDAALGMLSVGARGKALLELGLASGRTAVATEIAARHATETSAPDELRLSAVEALARVGNTYARRTLAEIAKSPDVVGRAAQARTSRASGAAGLTEREVEVLNLAGEGLTNREIGRRLHLSQHTVARHLANSREKLGALNRADAAVRLGRLTSTETGSPRRTGHQDSPRSRIQPVSKG